MVTVADCKLGLNRNRRLRTGAGAFAEPIGPSIRIRVAVTARERLLALLADGGWHTRAEIEEAGVHYPDAWVRVLRVNGCHVDVTEQGFRLVGDEKRSRAASERASVGRGALGLPEPRPPG
jgi:hypothetical protein